MCCYLWENRGGGFILEDVKMKRKESVMCIMIFSVSQLSVGDRRNRGFILEGVKRKEKRANCGNIEEIVGLY
jgi:hypothetical protein